MPVCALQPTKARISYAHGADVNVRAYCGTPLDVARANRHASTEAILAAAGASDSLTP